MILRRFSKFAFTSRVFCNPSIAVYLVIQNIRETRPENSLNIALPLQVSVVVTKGQISISCQFSPDNLKLDGLGGWLVASLERCVAVEPISVVLLRVCWVGLQPESLRVARVVPQIDDVVLQTRSDVIRFAEN